MFLRQGEASQEFLRRSSLCVGPAPGVVSSCVVLSMGDQVRQGTFENGVSLPDQLYHKFTLPKALCQKRIVRFWLERRVNPRLVGRSAKYRLL